MRTVFAAIAIAWFAFCAVTSVGDGTQRVFVGLALLSLALVQWSEVALLVRMALGSTTRMTPKREG